MLSQVDDFFNPLFKGLCTNYKIADNIYRVP